MKGEKSKMAKKSTLTMACMLLTVGCTGLQTNSENSSKAGKNNNDLLVTGMIKMMILLLK